ncbi:autotransporter outer membrane beta-barrel domain-containing protein [Chthoniobacter flavus]|nr:hypothetical protein [Chthoniobacter flavus]
MMTSTPFFPRCFPESSAWKEPRNRDGTLPRRLAVYLALAVVLLGFCSLEARAQTYGPPKIVYGSDFVSYTGTTDYLVVPINGEDVTLYGDIYDSNWIVDSSYNVYDNNGTWYGIYDPSSHQIGPQPSAAFAVAADGVTFLDNLPGITVIDHSPIQGWATAGPFYNGTAYVARLENIGATFFQEGSSPWYFYDGSSNVTFDGRGEWPVSNVFIDLAQAMYVNGREYDYETTSYSPGTGSLSENVTYLDSATGETVGITLSANIGGSNTLYYSSSSIWGYWNGTLFTGSIDPSSGVISGLPSWVAITFSPATLSSTNGPALISWDNHLLSYYFTTADGKSVYWNAGDGSGDYTVIVASDDTVVALHGSFSTGGTWTSPGVFNFQGAPGTADILALDSNGDLLPGELSLGMTFLFGSDGPGHNIVGTGASMSTVYTFRRPASWGVKYANLSDGVYLVQDENGNYTAPPYKFQAASGETMINAIGGWPATNIYPQQLYINGIICAMVSGSQYDSGAGFPRNGGVSYRASAYDLTVVLSWNWVDASTGFQGFVTGKYGQSSSFQGNWDGLIGFTNVTNGAIVSVSPPSSVPTDGNPPQIAVNGSALKYDSLASAALTNAGTPGDVYTGPLGQSLTIYQNGSVSYVPGAGAAAITGSYNATTHQFAFGSGGDTVTVTGADGSSNTATITATDTGGHNLAASTGVSNSGGFTDVAGSLDVHGNSFTLGSWLDLSQASNPGLLLSFTPPAGGQQALFRLGSSLASANWIWSHAITDGSANHQAVMQLDSSNRLSLFAPTDGTTPTIIFDPEGVSYINGAIRIAPQGDILMGDFGN